MHRPSTWTYKRPAKSEDQARRDLTRVLAQVYYNELIAAGSDTDNSEKEEIDTDDNSGHDDDPEEAEDANEDDSDDDADDPDLPGDEEYEADISNHNMASTSASETTAAPASTQSPPASDEVKGESSPVARASKSTKTPIKSSSASSNSVKVDDSSPPAKSTRSSQRIKDAAKSSEVSPTPKHTGRAPATGKSTQKAKGIASASVFGSRKAADTDENQMIDDDNADIYTGTAAAHKAKNDKGRQAVKAAAPAKKGTKGKEPAVAPDDAPTPSPADGDQETTFRCGTLAEKPAGATLNKPWHCANRDCNTGQTWYPRDGGQDSYGRKVISNFFGRNKAETNRIHKDVWHNFCRKCYQRENYRATSKTAGPQAKCKVSIENIEMQLIRIELWRPEATFTVKLWKAADTRLNQFFKARSQPGATADSAKQTVTKAPEKNKHGADKALKEEWAFPVEFIEQLDANFCKEDQTIDDIRALLFWVNDLADNGQISCMPPIEFLINERADDETVHDPTVNYRRWCEREDALPGGGEGAAQEPEEETDADDEEAQDDSAPEQADHDTDASTAIESVEPKSLAQQAFERLPLYVPPAAVPKTQVRRVSVPATTSGWSDPDYRCPLEHFMGRKVFYHSSEVAGYTGPEKRVAHPKRKREDDEEYDADIDFFTNGRSKRFKSV